QGLMMRLTAARTVSESRRATMANLLILMPIAAAVVASGGWVAKSLVHAGVLPPDVHPDEAFFVAADFLARPGVFGLIMAALTAALMSTVDTLITAISAIVVNDVYNVRNPEASEEQLLKVARFSAVGVTLFGIALVPVFMGFDSIYSAHGAFTAAVTPPLVVTLMLGVFWRRFTPTAALWTMVAGSIAIVASIIWPELVAPFAHGVPMKEAGDGFMAGKDQYKFMRALYGLSVCFVIGVVVTLFTRARPLDAVRGLVWGTVEDAIATYKGSPGRETESAWVQAPVTSWERDEKSEELALPLVQISAGLAQQLEAAAGDLLYVSDRRAWLGGLRSTHVMVGEISDDDGLSLKMGATPWSAVIAAGRDEEPLRLKRLY
ncbi:MAG: hypothetical protein VX938_03265, partial [Myxococcota bacterium]|nr:hypothetical protein [Myxococcota bacterium]